MMKHRTLILPLTVGFSLGALSPVFAQTRQIDWASTISSTLATPSNALGKPDALTIGVNNTDPVLLGGFGAGDNVSYNTAALATLLGVSAGTLSQADFISFDANGSIGVTYETSTWQFTDGSNNLSVTHTFGGAPAGSVVALGNISRSAYQTFFSTATIPPAGDYAYILFDIDGFSSVNPSAPGFSLTLTAPGTANGSPDPDSFGFIVPEPATGGLLLLASAGLLGFRRARARRA